MSTFRYKVEGSEEGWVGFESPLYVMRPWSLAEYAAGKAWGNGTSLDAEYTVEVELYGKRSRWLVKVSATPYFESSKVEEL